MATARQKILGAVLKTTVCANGKNQIRELVGTLLKQLTGRDLSTEAPVKPTVVARGQVYAKNQQLYVAVNTYPSSPITVLVNPFTGECVTGTLQANYTIANLESNGFKYAGPDLNKLAGDLK